MTGVVTFDGAPPPGTINFGVGQPSADLLPVALVREASNAFFAEAQPFDINYGVPRGDARFLDALSDFLSRHYRAPTDSSELFVTGGNSQALDLVTTVFARAGDVVFVEEPSYFLAFKIFRDHGVKTVPIPVDGDGPCLEALETALHEHRPAFFYTIPSYHNPTGVCATAKRRQAVIKLAERHNFIVVADEPYQLLHYDEPPPPAMGTMIDSGVVLSMGSFSKILAPGLRLGWLQSSNDLLQKLERVGLIHSGGSINHISSQIVRHAFDEGALDSHVDSLRDAYRARLGAMDAALSEHFAGVAEWQRPKGGYFIWLKFADSIDTTPLKEKALERETGFLAGTLFSGAGGLRNCLRLSFAHYGEDDIREGIARLRPLFS